MLAGENKAAKRRIDGVAGKQWSAQRGMSRTWRQSSIARSARPCRAISPAERRSGGAKPLWAVKPSGMGAVAFCEHGSRLPRKGVMDIPREENRRVGWGARENAFFMVFDNGDDFLSAAPLTTKGTGVSRKWTTNRWRASLARCPVCELIAVPESSIGRCTAPRAISAHACARCGFPTKSGWRARRRVGSRRARCRSPLHEHRAL